MKYSFLNRTIAIALSFLVLFSTLSLTVEKHFCGDTLVDIAVFSKIDSCCGDANDSDALEITKNTCCKNEVDVVEGQDKLKITSIDDLTSIEKQILIAFHFTYIHLFESLPKKAIPNRDYSPPEIVKDIHVLDETFLI